MDKNIIAIKTYNKIADIYTKQYFYDNSDYSYVDMFLSHLSPKAKILDVGCGPGNLTKYIKEKGFHVEGIDLSGEMIKNAKKMVPMVSFKVMDMRKLKYKNSTFDGILSAYSLIHIPNDEIPKVLTNFYKILKNGGFIIIIAQKGSQDRIINEPLMKGERMFINLFTKERLHEFLKKAGFKIIFQEEKRIQNPDSQSDKLICTIAQK